MKLKKRFNHDKQIAAHELSAFEKKETAKMTHGKYYGKKWYPFLKGTMRRAKPK